MPDELGAGSGLEPAPMLENEPRAAAVRLQPCLRYEMRIVLNAVETVTSDVFRQ